MLPSHFSGASTLLTSQLDIMQIEIYTPNQRHVQGIRVHFESHIHTTLKLSRSFSDFTTILRNITVSTVKLIFDLSTAHRC